MGDLRPDLWYALASLGQYLARVKILGASAGSAPMSRNVVSGKKFTWVGQHARLNRFR